LGNTGFDAGDVAAKSVKARRFFELSAGLLEAEIENLLAHVAAICHEFGKRLFLDFFALILFHKIKSFPRSLMPRNKLGFNRQLGGGEAQRFASDCFSHTVHFEEHVRGFDHRDPGFERTFAFAHSSFERFLGEGFLGENANPHFAVPFHVARDGNASGLDLLGIEPATFQGHQTVLAKGNRLAARGKAGAATAVHFAVLNSFGH
jgi:hypothetical protein